MSSPKTCAFTLAHYRELLHAARAGGYGFATFDEAPRTLGVEVEAYRQLFNAIRPHEAIGMRRPLHLHLEAINDPQTTKLTEPETLPTS